MRGFIKAMVQGSFLLFFAVRCEAIEIVFNYGSGCTSDRINAMEHARSLWNGWISTSGLGESNTVEIAVNFESMAAETLGSAGPEWWGVIDDTAFTPAQYMVWSGGSDLHGSDGHITLNSNKSWYTGRDGNAIIGEHDLVTVTLHEIGHQLGMHSSYIPILGWGNTNPLSRELTQWDKLLRDPQGDAPSAWTNDFDESPNTGNVTFIGQYAKAANGGDPVPIYSPATYNHGSSLTHPDDFRDSGALMSHELVAGHAKHGLWDYEIAMFRDLGWDFASPTVAHTTGHMVEPLQTKRVWGNGGLWRWVENGASKGGLPPDSYTDVYLDTSPDGNSYFINVTKNSAANSLTVQPNAYLNMHGAALHVVGDVMNEGEIYLRSGWTTTSSLSASTLHIGNAGKLTIESNGSLSVSEQIVGIASGIKGEIIQTGGTNTASTGLSLGENAGSAGQYSLENGNLSAGNVIVGRSGQGIFFHSNGDSSVSTLDLGYNSGSTGSYGLSGGTLQTTNTMIVGRNGNGYFTHTGGTNSVGSNGLVVGGYSGSHGTYELRGTGQLSSISNQNIGDYGTGLFKQTGGSNSIGGGLVVGARSGSNGTYELSGGQLSSVAHQNIGKYGTGLFKQTDGTNSVGSDLVVGVHSGSNGTYELSGNGKLSSLGTQSIGESGVGIFKQTGGTNSVGENLLVGGNSGSNGTYELSNGQLSSVGYHNIGVNGTGLFKQTGGINTVDISVVVGLNSGSHGTYELSGAGVLSTKAWQNVGAYGTGIFKQTGGTNYVGKFLSVGVFSGSSGTYELSGTGQLSSSDSQYIGDYGKGLFKQTGGRNAVGSMVIVGTHSGSIGTYELSGDGDLSSTSSQIIGYNGTGTFKQTGGTNTVGDLLVIGAYANGKYELSGNGRLSSSANVIVGNNGRGSLEITDGGLASVAGTLTIDNNGNGDSFINMSTGGMLALLGDADDSLASFLGIVEGTDAIRYWDDSASDWANIIEATYGQDYTLSYLAEGDLSGYTVLTVGVPEPSTLALLIMGAVSLLAYLHRNRQ